MKIYIVRLTKLSDRSERVFKKIHYFFNTFQLLVGTQYKKSEKGQKRQNWY